jgi:hypothetical protein
VNWVFHVGPTSPADGTGCVLTCVDEKWNAGGEGGVTPHAALAKLVQRLGTHEITASPDLRDEALALGVRVAPLPQFARELQAVQAFMMGSGGYLATNSAMSLLGKIVSYVEAAPWRWLDSDTPLRVHYQTRKHPVRVLEALVAGNASKPMGLAVYNSRPRASAKLGRKHRLDGVLTLTLRDEPSWVAEPMHDCYGFRLAPSVARSGHKQLEPLNADDCDCLEAVLWAIAQLTPDNRSIQGEFADDGCRILVRVEVGGPSRGRS